MLHPAPLLPFLAFAHVGGTLWPSAAPWLSGASVAGAVLLARSGLRGAAAARLLGAGAFFVLLGACSAQARLDQAARGRAHLSPFDLPIPTTCVLRAPHRRPDRGPLRVRAARCLVGSSVVPLSLDIHFGPPGDGGGTLLFSVVEGRLERHRGRQNPGDPVRTELDGVTALLVAAEPVTPAASRRSLRSWFDERLPDDDEAQRLVKAMVLGDTRALSPTTVDRFRRAGLSHVLAVSGLHAGTLLSVILLLVSFLAGHLRLSRTSTTLLLAASAVLSGFALIQVVGVRPSVVRAVVLLVLLLLARRAGRPSPGGMHALLLVWIVAVTWEPSWLHDAGFLLSFTAVASFTWILSGTSPFLRPIATSLVVTVATAPWVSLFFGWVPLAGLLTNLVGIPATAVIVVSSSLALIPGPWSDVLMAAAQSGASLLLLLLRSDLLSAGVLSLQLSPGWFVAALAPVLALHGRHRPVLFPAAALGLALAVAASIPMHRPLYVHLLSTGQGDAAVLRTPSGRTVVVDTGPPYARALQRSLSRSGQTRIDHLVLTHAHADHDGALRDILDRWKVGRVVVPPMYPASTVAELGQRSIPVRFVSAGDTLRIDDDLHVAVLAPTRTAVDENDASVVLLVTHGTTRLLLTGDAERASEARLVRDWTPFLDADIVKVAHHGSKTSSSLPFVLRTGAATAVVSVGRNPYGLPDPLIVDRWRSVQAVVHRTDIDGAFCLRSYGTGYDIDCS